jgi:hypothetical protein
MTSLTTHLIRFIGHLGVQTGWTINVAIQSNSFDPHFFRCSNNSTCYFPPVGNKNFIEQFGAGGVISGSGFSSCSDGTGITLTCNREPLWQIRSVENTQHGNILLCVICNGVLISTRIILMVAG